jgi:hypothetical protein
LPLPFIIAWGVVGCEDADMLLIKIHKELANLAISTVVASLPSTLILRVYEKNNSCNKTEYASGSVASLVPQVRQKNVRQFS